MNVKKKHCYKDKANKTTKDNKIFISVSLGRQKQKLQKNEFSSSPATPTQDRRPGRTVFWFPRFDTGDTGVVEVLYSTWTFYTGCLERRLKKYCQFHSLKSRRLFF